MKKCSGCADHRVGSYVVIRFNGGAGIAGPVGELDRDVDLSGPHGSVVGSGHGRHHTYECARAWADEIDARVRQKMAARCQ